MSERTESLNKATPATLTVGAVTILAQYLRGQFALCCPPREALATLAHVSDCGHLIHWSVK